MNRRPIPSPLLAAIAAAFSVTLAACGGGNAEAPPAGPQAPQVAAAPVVTITNDITGEVATGPIVFSFSFNRDVGTTFTSEDVTVTGGTKGAFTRVSGTRATLLVTPTANTTGMVVVTVPAGAVTDALGAPNATTSAQKAFNTVIRTPLVTFDEATAPRFENFGGTEDAAIVTDPADGANKVARVVKSATAELWAGTTVVVCPNAGFPVLPFSSTLTTMSARVWSPVAGIPVRMKVEDSTDGSKSVETEATVTVASGWQTLNFNFANPATGTAALNLATTYDKASIFFNFGTPGSATGARTYFFDDIAFVGSTFTPACRAPAGGGTGGGDTVLADFDTINTPVLGFEGAEGSAIENGPAGGGSGRSFRVLRSGGQTFAGALIDVAVPLTATRRTISAQVNSPAAGVRMVIKLEGPGGVASAELASNETVVAGWQTLTWTFSAADAARTYNRIVLLPNLGTVDAPPGRSYYFDTISLVAAPAATPGTLVADFDSINTPVLGFEGAEGSAIENGPAGGGSGRSFRVLRSGGQVFAGALIDVAVPVSATRRTISADVNAPAAGVRMVMKLEGPGGVASAEVAANETVVAGWQTLTWTFSAADAARTYNRIVLLPNLGTVDAPPGRSYYFDNITVAGEAAGGGEAGATGTVLFSSGYRSGGTSEGAGTTAQNGVWGYFSGDFSNVLDTFTGGGFANSTPPLTDDQQFFFIAVTTSAPTAPATNPPTSGGFLGMYVTHPGLRLNGQTTLAVNLAIDANFFRQTSNKTIDVFVVGKETFSNGSGGNCNVTLRGRVTPTTADMITYTLPLASLELVQPCNGGGFTSGVTTVAQALAQPIGAVNTQFSFPNVNTTINSGTASAPVYATGITRGKTEFR